MAASSSRAARSWPSNSRPRAMTGSGTRSAPSSRSAPPEGPGVMTEVATVKDTYLAAFEAFERGGAGGSPGGLLGLRREAIARFAEQGFPTVRLEDWKYTSVAPIAATAFRFADGAFDSLPAEAIEALVVAQPVAHRPALVHRRHSAQRS